MGNRLNTPKKMLMVMRTTNRFPIPDWAAWSAVRTTPTIDSARVPFCVA